MRAGGAFGLASVIALLAGLIVIKPSDATLSAAPESIVDWYSTTASARVFTGGYLEVLGLLCFLPFAACLVSVLRRGESDEAFAGRTAQMGAVAYLATSLTPGMSSGAAALWVAQHQPDSSTVYALNNLRTFSYQMSLMAWAVFFGGVAAAAFLGRTLPRWLAGTAAFVAVALVAGVAGAYDHWHDLASLLGLLWVVAASAWLLRARGTDAAPSEPRVLTSSAA